MSAWWRAAERQVKKVKVITCALPAKFLSVAISPQSDLNYLSSVIIAFFLTQALLIVVLAPQLETDVYKPKLNVEVVVFL